MDRTQRNHFSTLINRVEDELRSEKNERRWSRILYTSKQFNFYEPTSYQFSFLFKDFCCHARRFFLDLFVRRFQAVDDFHLTFFTYVLSNLLVGLVVVNFRARIVKSTNKITYSLLVMHMVSQKAPWTVRPSIEKTHGGKWSHRWS